MSTIPSFDAIQQEIANILDIPDEELTDEQRLAVEDYLNELGDRKPKRWTASRSSSGWRRPVPHP